MRNTSTQKAPIQCMQSSVIREDIKKYLGKIVDVSECTGNQRYTHYQGKFLSISTNLFSIEIALGKTNKTIKSFPIIDILIGKITISEIN
ncbi:MAG: hypothetical protein IJW28_00395 [Clostridia bacterium]|nr:hypothetical protein [Clostridia bacterium]